MLSPRSLVRLLVASTVSACAAHATGPALALRAACADAQYWNGSACVPRGTGAAEIAAGKAALKSFAVDDAKAKLDAGAAHGPLDHDANIALWESRAIAAAYNEDVPAARAAFDMLLALDPGHFLSYKESPKATGVFEDMRSQHRTAPEISVDYPRDGEVGAPVPLALEVLADPKGFLQRAEIYVRTHGDPQWRAADVSLHAGAIERATIPPVIATANVQLELYVRAYDPQGNEVLRWGDAAHPRELQLRYVPPTPWYRTWWGITALGTAAALAAGIVVYELTLTQPTTVNGAPSLQ